MRFAKDAEIFARAVAEDRVVVSPDTDFGALLALGRTAKPSVVPFRRVPQRPEDQVRLLLSNLSKIAEPLAPVDGEWIVVEELARTARWTAAARARESERPDRLFYDPLAAVLAGEEGFAQLEAEPEEARNNPYLAVRTRFFDDWLAQVVNQGSVRQVVLLAAGMDSRAFRLDWPEGVVLWELDQPELLELKDRLLAGAGVLPACERRTVGVDLAGDEWSDRLRADGFRPSEASVWLAEGFFVYLDDACVDRILASSAELGAPGSRLAADFLSRDFLTCDWMSPYLNMLKQHGTPWRFGTNEPEALLARHGWRVEMVKQPGEEGAHYGRWPWPVAPRDVPGFPRSFLVTAVREANGLRSVRFRRGPGRDMPVDGR